jgi:hypothetical protein
MDSSPSFDTSLIFLELNKQIWFTNTDTKKGKDDIPRFETAISRMPARYLSTVFEHTQHSSK